MHDANGVTVLTRVVPNRDAQEEHTQAEHEQPTEDERGAIDLQRAHVTPLHRAPHRPVPQPVELVRQREIRGVAERGQCDAVRRESVARHRVRRDHERSPREERRRDEPAPHDDERQCAERHTTLHEQRDPGREQTRRPDDHADHAEGNDLPHHEGGGADGQRVRDGAESGGALALHALHRIEHQQETEQRRQELHLRHRERAGREQERRVESAKCDERVGDRLHQDQRHEQVETRLTAKLAHFGARHLPDRLPKACCARLHGELAERERSARRRRRR